MTPHGTVTHSLRRAGVGSPKFAPSLCTACPSLRHAHNDRALQCFFNKLGPSLFLNAPDPHICLLTTSPLVFLFKIIFILCVCLSAPPPMPAASRDQKGVSEPLDLELQTILSHHIADSCWESNPAPLQKQIVLLTAEPAPPLRFHSHLLPCSDHKVLLRSSV